MMPKVYVVQEPLVKDRVTQLPKPKFDISPARKYGEIEYLLGWSDDTTMPSSLLWFLRERLRGFSDEDYLLMTGDPNAMALAAAIAMEINDGRAKILQWDRRAGYQSFQLDMNSQPPLNFEPPHLAHHH